MTASEGRPSDDRQLTSARDGLSVQEAADRIGMHPQSIYKWIRDGDLRVTRFGPRGGTMRIHPADLDDLVRPSGPPGA